MAMRVALVSFVVVLFLSSIILLTVGEEVNKWEESTFSEFHRYVTATTTTTNLTDPYLIQLAKLRSEALIGFMKHDPEKTLQYFDNVSTTISQLRAIAPSTLLQFLEIEEHFSGDFIVYCGTPFPESIENVQSDCVHTILVPIDNNKNHTQYNAFVGVHHPLYHHISVNNVPLHTFRIANSVVIRPSPVVFVSCEQEKKKYGLHLGDRVECYETVDEQQINAKTLMSYLWTQEYQNNRPRTHAQTCSRILPLKKSNAKIIWFLIDFPDSKGFNVPDSQFINTMSEIRDFMNVSSNGQLMVDPTFYRTPIITMNFTLSTVLAGIYSYNNIAIAARNHASINLSPSYDICNYDFDVYVWKPKIYTWAGLAALGGRNIWINNAYIMGTVLTHEIGHNLAMEHARFLSSTGVVEYGDPFDVMGASYTYFPANQFTVASKALILKYIPYSSIINITPSQLYDGNTLVTDKEFILYPHDSKLSEGKTVGLTVTRPSPFVFSEGTANQYWVSFRNSFEANPAINNGVLIHMSYGVNKRSILMDTNPTTQTPDDAPLTMGKTYSVCINSTSGLHITTRKIFPCPMRPSIKCASVVVNFGVVPSQIQVSICPTNLIFYPNQQFKILASVVESSNRKVFVQWTYGSNISISNPLEMRLSMPGIHQVHLQAGNYYGAYYESDVNVVVVTAEGVLPSFQTLVAPASPMDCSKICTFSNPSLISLSSPYYTIAFTLRYFSFKQVTLLLRDDVIITGYRSTSNSGHFYQVRAKEEDGKIHEFFGREISASLNADITFAFVFSGTIISLYINGQFYSSATANTRFFFSSNSWSLGSASQSVNANIKRLVVYNYPLSPSQILVDTQNSTFSTNNSVVSMTPYYPLQTSIQKKTCSEPATVSPKPTCPAVTCPTLENWPSSSVGTTVYLSCPIANQVGKLIRSCLADGNWSNVISTCDFPNCIKDGVWQETKPFSHANISCSSMSRQGNYATRYCNAGVWDNPIDTCSCGDIQSSSYCSYNRRYCTSEEYIKTNCAFTCQLCLAYCPADSGFPRTSGSSIARLPCPNGQYGAINRICNANGVWSTVQNNCTTIFCKDNGSWRATLPSTTVTLLCPSPGDPGTRYRACTAKGEWENEVNTCSACHSDGIWPATMANDTATIPCTTGEVGTMTRLCQNDRTWGPIVSKCNRVQTFNVTAVRFSMLYMPDLPHKISNFATASDIPISRFVVLSILTDVNGTRAEVTIAFLPNYLHDQHLEELELVNVLFSALNTTETFPGLRIETPPYPTQATLKYCYASKCYQNDEAFCALETASSGATSPKKNNLWIVFVVLWMSNFLTSHFI